MGGTPVPPGNRVMDELIKDICRSIRDLTDRPAFRLASTLSLAVVIGTCAVLFSIVDSVLLRQLPNPKAEQLAELKQISPSARRANLCDPSFDREVQSLYE